MKKDFLWVWGGKKGPESRDQWGHTVMRKITAKVTDRDII